MVQTTTEQAAFLNQLSILRLSLNFAKRTCLRNKQIFWAWKTSSIVSNKQLGLKMGRTALGFLCEPPL